MSLAVSEVALVGCGAWGANIARVLAQLKALAAIFDADQSRAQAMAQEHGVAHAPDFAEMLKRDDIKGVAIAAPAALHASLAIAALNAGKQVYVEKPIALSLDDAQAMVAAARANDRVLMVGHLLQYHPVFMKLLEMVKGGALGKLQYIYSNRLNLGRIRTEEDALWSLAPHDLSMILALAGARPTKVTATGQAAVQPNVADIATAHLEFASGLKAHVFCSWLSPYKEQRLTVVGDQAMAVFDDTAATWEDKLILYDHKAVWNGSRPELKKGNATQIMVPKSEPLRAELEHFIGCVRGLHAPRTGPEEAIPVLEALIAAQDSMKEKSR